MEYKNRKVKFDYQIKETIEAGIKLLSWEVKSLDNNLTSLNGTYCLLDEHLYVKNLIVKPRNIDSNNHEIVENRDKVLLVTKAQKKNIEKHLKDKGNTIIPNKLYRKNGKWKINICLCTGRNKKDKREYIKEKDFKRHE